MGFSEVIAAIGAVGISSFILALVKLLAFFKDANKEKVTDILTRVDDDNKRWYTRYQETLDELTEVRKNSLDELTKSRRETDRQRILAARYRIELLTSGVSESRLDAIEKEMSDDD